MFPTVCLDKFSVPAFCLSRSTAKNRKERVLSLKETSAARYYRNVSFPTNIYRFNKYRRAWARYKTPKVVKPIKKNQLKWKIIFISWHFSQNRIWWTEIKVHIHPCNPALLPENSCSYCSVESFYSLYLYIWSAFGNIMWTFSRKDNFCTVLSSGRNLDELDTSHSLYVHVTL